MHVDTGGAGFGMNCWVGVETSKAQASLKLVSINPRETKQKPVGPSRVSLDLCAQQRARVMIICCCVPVRETLQWNLGRETGTVILILAHIVVVQQATIAQTKAVQTVLVVHPLSTTRSLQN